ncbi:diguanylate cyclase [Desulfopila sp. IMCC35008]|uniref:diguanylate cyclase n=1 Tax=Desulfopila sp. IMCC35008 TaxID=2653858 RepID=UPI0013D3ACA2|nr:diguanylate cyclase [Desulfopila sp. IMCC35008]
MEQNEQLQPTDNLLNRNYRIYYSVLFIGFGILITILTALVTYKIRIMDIASELERDVTIELNRKQEELTSYLSGLGNYVTAARTSASLIDYIRTPSPANWEKAANLFYVLAKTNPNIMQLRYLDAAGLEKIRIDQGFGRNEPDIITGSKLQDKSHRYYFTETAQLGPNSFWTSNLDLNVENRQIEVPHKPVIRVASPIFVDQIFSGIVIINIHAKQFLNTFTTSSFFNISLIDKDGFIIFHPQQEKRWSRYLQSGHTLQTAYPNEALTVLNTALPLKIRKHGEFFAASIEPLLIKDGAIIIFEPKKEKILKIEKERRNAIVFLVFIIFLLSLPLAYIISRAPANLSRKILDQNNTLKDYFELIDTNIPSCTTDLEGTLLTVSTAFIKITGYLKPQLIGMRLADLEDQDQSESVCAQIPTDLLNDTKWEGDIHFRTANGGHLYTTTRAYPKYDSANKVVAFSIIHRDITDQKRIEELSIKDDLTGLYNRRFFNETIARELGRAQRESSLLSFAMLDVDYFKQYNDFYGHQKGDEVLKVISKALNRKMTRGSDFCFRLGGEEFGILFLDTQPEQATAFVDGIRQEIQDLELEHSESEIAKVVTVSIGLLTLYPDADSSVDYIFRKADEALYTAKNRGRNRLVAIDSTFV